MVLRSEKPWWFVGPKRGSLAGKPRRGLPFLPIGFSSVKADFSIAQQGRLSSLHISLKHSSCKVLTVAPVSSWLEWHSVTSINSINTRSLSLRSGFSTAQTCSLISTQVTYSSESESSTTYSGLQITKKKKWKKKLSLFQTCDLVQNLQRFPSSFCGRWRSLFVQLINRAHFLLITINSKVQKLFFIPSKRDTLSKSFKSSTVSSLRIFLLIMNPCYPRSRYIGYTYLGVDLHVQIKKISNNICVCFGK